MAKDHQMRTSNTKSSPYKVRLYFNGQNRQPDQILRQTPGSRGAWKDIQFLITEGDEAADFLVVFGSGHSLIQEKISKQNTLFVGSEPPAIKSYPEAYLAQFHSAICSDPNAIHPRIKLSQQGYPWFCGLGTDAIKAYDDYKAEDDIPKSGLISVVCSNKSTKPGHRKRFEFVQRLKEVFGDDLDLYGSGQNFVPDKADAIRPYQYHVVIENSISPHYWSEKLADSYLEGAFPFYSGCPDLDHYFSPDAFRLINIDDLDASVATIRGAIESNLHQTSKQALLMAKHQVLDDYNLFNIISQHIETEGYPENNQGANFRALPGKYFRRGKFYRIKSTIRNLFKK